eukprot:3729578-Prymnesium_polylepis.1
MSHPASLLARADNGIASGTPQLLERLNVDRALQDACGGSPLPCLHRRTLHSRVTQGARSLAHARFCHHYRIVGSWALRRQRIQLCLVCSPPQRC